MDNTFKTNKRLNEQFLGIGNRCKEKGETLLSKLSEFLKI